MALSECPECNREISDKAEACPGCEYPIAPLNEPPAGSRSDAHLPLPGPGKFVTTEARRKNRKTRWMLVVLMVIGIGGVVMVVTESEFIWGKPTLWRLWVRQYVPGTKGDKKNILEEVGKRKEISKRGYLKLG